MMPNEFKARLDDMKSRQGVNVQDNNSDLSSNVSQNAMQQQQDLRELNNMATLEGASDLLGNQMSEASNYGFTTRAQFPGDEPTNQGENSSSYVILSQ